MRILHLFLLLILSFTLIETSYAQKNSSEEKIKASYIFNFIRFINWPSTELGQKKQSIQICIFKHNRRFEKAFKPVLGKKVRGHSLKFKKISNTKNIPNCHLLYIGKAEKSQIAILLPELTKHRVLSISDTRNFCAKGGIIGMVKKKGRIRVEINLKRAKSAGFKISSNLLEVATIVDGP